ncbi:protein of unknown function [Duganella sp. CF517]|uniref:DUF4123 domain-containing protein n=1 Tax=Duganella sp. CF517 TaxID=1881038 RepID=UPI0008D07569|nr:DUF4123 domain-containing protein [Duganella sp. CF517]SEN06306.1 protein of unknown function [Duganella sp. CF517]
METQTYTYALLDCSAHEHAFRDLTTRFADVQWKSLFDGTPEEHLVTAAPLLIATPRDNDKLIAWLEELEQAAPSVSWIGSPYALPVLAPMLTRRLQCEINDDQQVVLRFYDPRILLGLPSALTAQQKRYFFAPVSSWIAWEPRREERYAISIEPATSADIARFAFAPISLTLPQRDQLMYFDKENLYDSIIQQWRDTCPDDIAGIKPNMLREIAITAVARANSYGITDAAAQHLFAGLMMTVSPSFDDNSLVKSYLKAENVPPADRLSNMISALPSEAWEQITASKRMDALFELPSDPHGGRA